jgi:hypothetical protein
MTRPKMQMLFGRDSMGFGVAERHRRNVATRPRLKDSFFVRLQAAFSGPATVFEATDWQTGAGQWVSG